MSFVRNILNFISITMKHNSDNYIGKVWIPSQNVEIARYLLQTYEGSVANNYTFYATFCIYVDKPL